MILPLWLKLTATICFCLFILVLIIIRDPRDWRRLYQALFHSQRETSVNQNKKLDEMIRKRGVFFAALFLMMGSGLFWYGMMNREIPGRTDAESLKSQFFRENMERLRKEEEKRAALERAGRGLMD